MNNLRNKRIIVGVTGGIAAYKSADFIRQLKKQGADIRVVMTAGAKAFITPLTLQAVSGRSVHEDLFDTQAEAAMGHIELARWADLMVIAPASADFMSRLAQGRGDDLLSTLCLARKAGTPLAIAPAMNCEMWDDKATQANLELLSQREVFIWGPGEGEQACGDVGLGRMLEPVELLEHANRVFATGSLAGQRVLLSAGPTYEAIDPVRFLGNRSSGKMGFALAQAAREAGADVTLVAGPVHLATPDGVARLDVESAKQMYDCVMEHVKQCDIFIAVAAVADYHCATQTDRKIKRSSESLHLELVPNPDIVASVAALADKPFTVGFAAETHDVLEHGRSKLQRKKLDALIVNQVGMDGQGFGSDHNAATLLWGDGGEQVFDLQSKATLARELIHQIGRLRK